MEVREGPEGLALRVEGLGHDPDLLRDLGVARQGIDHFRVGRSEESFAHASEPGLGRRSGFLDALVACEKAFEVDRLEFLSVVHDENRRKALPSPDAVPDDHHAGLGTGVIEGEVERQNRAGIGIYHQGQPRASQSSPVAGSDKFDVEFRMVDMDDFERTGSVARSGPLQMPMKDRMGVGDPFSFPFSRLLLFRSLPDSVPEGFVAGNRQMFPFAVQPELFVGGPDTDLLFRFVDFRDRFRHQAFHGFVHPR